MKLDFNIPVGTLSTKSLEVTREFTIARDDERLPAVFATPVMIYLMEAAAAEAIQKYLPAGWISVGVQVNVKHLAATPIGATVTARAEVIASDEGVVTFAVEAYDGIEKIGEGIHVRAAIEVARFLKRVNAKKANLPPAAS
jgi:fluoroacetyl-CoA thioesterase